MFKNEVELLRKNDIDVITYERGNDEILSYNVVERLKLPFSTIWSSRVYREIKSLLKREKPDVCHFHNIYFLISPSALHCCRDSGVPVVQTLHNFRLFCVNGLLYRSGKVCEDCLGRHPFKGLYYGCFKSSRLYSLPVTAASYYHDRLGTWDRCVDVFIALTDFGRRKFIEAGLPEDKLFVKPNFLGIPVRPDFNSREFAFFASRISEYKGLITLLNAWEKVKGCRLRIAGDGPFMKNVTDHRRAHAHDNVDILGRVSHADVIDNMRRARFCILPSELYEGFPMNLVEAYACGKPVVASRLGAMEEIVVEGETGLLFEPGDPDDLAEKANFMIKNENETLRMGMRAREQFEALYSPGRNFSMLMDIYKRAMG